MPELNVVTGVPIGCPAIDRTTEIPHCQAEEKLLEVVSMVLALSIFRPWRCWNEGRKKLPGRIIRSKQGDRCGVEMKAFDGKLEGFQCPKDNFGIQPFGFAIQSVKGRTKSGVVEIAGLDIWSSKKDREVVCRKGFGNVGKGMIPDENRAQESFDALPVGQQMASIRGNRTVDEIANLHFAKIVHENREWPKKATRKLDWGWNALNLN